MTSRRFRCAIYTRKSTEEGLDQAFNSLDAQRESCAAYIASQAGESWVGLSTLYDDGGYSGGSMERPGLQRLMTDIGKGLVDVVVVYKIDRLTRSLADFARIVEKFDARSVSFVSVTQAFNTTTSMGRLTLNVLLSFAQFEREVGAERVRDKIAASKQKGLWMGGCPPLGYNIKGRTLEIIEPEAETIRLIFDRYLELGSIRELRAELDGRGIKTKSWTSKKGIFRAGGCWHIGPLQILLRNPVFTGLIRHRDKTYPGQHPAIIDRDVFHRVQRALDANSVAHRRKRTIDCPSLLAGLIFDDQGSVMSPQRRRPKNGRQPPIYYVSQAVIQGREPVGSLPRAPAERVEHMILHHVMRAAEAAGIPIEVPIDPTSRSFREKFRRWLSRVIVAQTGMTLVFDAGALAEAAGVATETIESRLQDCFGSLIQQASKRHQVTIEVLCRLKLLSGRKTQERWDTGNWATAKPRVDRALLAALCRANEWKRRLEAGHVTTIDELSKLDGVERRHVQRTLRLAFLAPDIQEAIALGSQPSNLTLTSLLETDLPLSWSDQRRDLSM